MAVSARVFARCMTSNTSVAPSLRTSISHNTHRILPRRAFQLPLNRGYATGPARSRASVWAYGLTFLATGLGAGALGLYANRNFGAWDTSNTKTPNDAPNASSAPASKAASSFTPKKENYQQVYNAIAKRLEEKDDYDDGSYGPVLVRLAWHCSGTYDKDTKTGGSNGATMRFAPEGDHGANAGLKAARDFLEPVHSAFPWITYSDLWTLAGVCAIQEMQGPVIPWRPGRSDRDVAFCTPDGRLPDGAKEQSHLRAIFGRMGFDDREIVALSGAHALGRCHTDRSGFEGPWSFSPTVMSNDYYRLLMDEKWGWRKWNGPKQYEDKSTKSLMMLPTDMALIEDKAFRTHVERYAKDEKVFFEEFSDVIMKLLELGVPFQSKEEDRMSLVPLEQ